MFLPIIQRELRIAARQSKTWWRRVLVVSAAAVVFFLVYLDMRRYALAPQMGKNLFEALSAFTFVFCLLAGPLAASDCISGEKREGTLGLMFLTHLRAYDVVLGKMFAASFTMFYALLALLPLLAMPLLLGGVGMSVFLVAALALLNVFLFSLAAAIFVSSVARSSRASVVGVVLALAALTLGLPLLGEEVLRIRLYSTEAPFFYALCPLYSMQCVFSASRGGWNWPIWLNFGALHALTWALMAGACLFTSRNWKDRPPTLKGLRWRERLQRWSLGTPATRLAYRRRALIRNPLFWLDDRYRLQKTVLWVLLMGSILFWVIGYLDRNRWNDEEVIIFLGLGMFYVLCLWLALQAAHRFTEDRQSGTLELLLCSPLGAQGMLRGRMQALRRQFGWPVVVVMAFASVMLIAYCYDRSGGGFMPESFVLAVICAIVLVPWQAYGTARVGLYESLIQKNSLAAAIGTAWRVFILPWLLFLVLVIFYEELFRRAPLGFRISDEMAILCWFAIQALGCLVFVAQANWQLHYNFRGLAARTPKGSWWLRLLKI